jgi:hypothetical protein
MIERPFAGGGFEFGARRVGRLLRRGRRARQARIA